MHVTGLSNCSSQAAVGNLAILAEPISFFSPFHHFMFMFWRGLSTGLFNHQEIFSFSSVCMGFAVDKNAWFCLGLFGKACVLCFIMEIYLNWWNCKCRILLLYCSDYTYLIVRADCVLQRKRKWQAPQYIYKLLAKLNICDLQQILVLRFKTWSSIWNIVYRSNLLQ